MESIVKHLRERSGLTQSALALRLGVKQTAISNYETGRRVPKPIIAKRFVQWAEDRGFQSSLEDIYQQHTFADDDSQG